MQLIFLSLCITQFHQIAWGLHFSFGRNLVDNTFSPPPKATEQYSILSSGGGPIEIQNSSSYRSEEENKGYLVFPNKNILQIDQNISVSPSTQQNVPSTYSNASNASSVVDMGNSTPILSNESHPQSTTEFNASESSSATTEERTNSTVTSVSIPVNAGNATSPPSMTEESDEEEGVARGKPSTTEGPKNSTSMPPSIYQRAWTLISDTYTLSILVPVAAGVVFATSIILTIATCRCLRRRCLRRRLRKKTLPDSVKNMRPSDRARLLADTSDEEF